MCWQETENQAISCKRSNNDHICKQDLFLFIGMTAGAIGSFIGTPAEISLIRMTSDGR